MQTRAKILHTALLSAVTFAYGVGAPGLAVAQIEAALAEAGGGPTDFEIEPTRSLFEVTTGTENSTATLRVGTQLSRPKFEVRTNPSDIKATAGTGTFTSVSFSLSGPIDKTNDMTELATLDGLGNAIKAGFKANIFVMGLRKPAYPSVCDTLKAEMVRKGLMKLDEEVQCDKSNIAEHLSGGDAREDFSDLFYDRSGAGVFGVEAKVGTQEYDYRDVNTFDKRSTSEVPWSAGVHGGYMNDTIGLVSIGFRYEQAFKEADKRTLCTPIPDTSLSECETGPSGPPKDKDAAVLFLSWRRHIPYLSDIEQFRFFAVGPRVSFDAEDEVFGVDLPIYLWGSSSGPLNGGIRGGWRDDTEDFSFSVFVGSSFSYFN